MSPLQQQTCLFFHGTTGLRRYRRGRCVKANCRKLLEAQRPTPLERKEFHISGLCVRCQRQFFRDKEEQ